MDIASLGIKIDTSDAAKAVTDLDKVVQSGEKAEKAAEGIAAGFDKASASASDLSSSERKLSETLDEAKARLLATAKASLESSDYYQRLTTSVNTNAFAMESSGSSVSSLAALQRRLQAESDALVGSTDRQAEATKKAAAATGVQAEGLQELLGKINPVQKKLQELDDLQLQLTKHRKAGNIDDAGFKSYSADIEAARIKQKGFNDEAGKSGGVFDKLKLGTRQAQENVVQLGNAFSTGDIGSGVRAIAQLGAGAGSSALSLLALVGPIAAVTTVLAGLTAAYYKGSAETKAFNDSLILTGNYAGTNAGQLSDMAKQIGATVGTTGAAASALASLAGTGKIAGGSFEEIASAALSMEEATGKSVDATIAEFVKIAKDPVAAAKELNDQYHFLTASVYSQIVALKEQGDTIGAAKLLTDTYADTVRDRSKQITNNLGYVERAWKGITDEAKKSLDAIKNIGRDEGPAKRITELTQKVAFAESALKADPDDKDAKKKLAESKLELDFLVKQRDTQDAINKAQALYQETQDKGQDAQRKFDTRAKSARSNKDKRKDELDDLQKEIDDIRRANPNDSRLSQTKIDQQKAAINDKYKDPKAAAGSVDLTGFNTAQNALKELQATYSNTQKQLDAAQKAGLISQDVYATQRAVLIKAEKEEVTAAYEAEISALEAAKGKKSTNAAQSIQLDQKIADARTNMVKAQKDADGQLDVLATAEKGRLDKQKYAIDQYVQALGQQQKALELAGQRAVLGVGQGDRQNALNGELNSQQDRFAQQSLELENQRSDPSRNMSKEEFSRKSQALADANKKATDQIRQNYADVEAAQGDWTKGATAAWENYLDSAKNIAGQTKSLFGNAFSSMEDSIVSFAMTGKASFADFAKSILADMARIATRQASSALLGSLVGAAASYFGGGAAAGTGNGLAAGSAGAVSSNLGASQAGYSSTYIDGFRAAGGPVDPDSLYRVNELGPELYSEGGKSYLMTGANGGSVTPLTTGGGPGVSAPGASGGAPQVYINISSDGKTDVSSDQSGLESFGAEIGKFVEQKFKQLEAKSLSPQGNIRKAIQGRG
ncbi:phage tail tape measure protein [Pseudomonas sp. MF6747]|uniref:phage tail tape measure protein n=1 Tax=Pseudomonas sp. MF6747 TaxID=2797527 RepID=UPI00190D3F48|nr:phage tail tape measure protein [Pseudomonas sp. MF6747]MBK3510707.1 phage tail tape measure protein [Pseudomonas sp. MF6747]